MNGGGVRGTRIARVSYQGIPCLYGAWENRQGTESGHGSVVMTAESFGALKISGDPWAPLALTPTGTTDRNAPAGPAPALGAGLQVRGALVFDHGDAPAVVFPQLYLSDLGVEDLRRSVERKADRGLVRVPLVDVRYLWSRGDVHGAYNVRVKGIRRDAPPAFDPESLRPNGKPYTLADLIQICLSRLPGRVSLTGDAEEIRSADAIEPHDVVWIGESAVDALNRLLRAYDFRFVYPGFGHEAQIWRVGRGAPKANDAGGVLVSLTLPPEKQIAPQTVRSRKRTAAFAYKPRSVRVVGRPIVREVRVSGLVPVGEKFGELVPLDEALAQFGVERFEAAKMVLLSDQELRGFRRSTAGLSDLAIKEIRRWAFKWFALPETARGYLPILPRRARATVEGGRGTPAVFADTFEEVPLALVQVQYERKRVEIKAAIEAIKKRAAATKEAANVPTAPPTEPIPSDDSFDGSGFGSRNLGNLEFGEHGEGRIATERAVREDLDTVLRRELGDRIDAEAAHRILSAQRDLATIAESEADEVRFYNVFLAPISPSDYSIDGERGLVMFDGPIGNIDTGGRVAPETLTLPFSGRDVVAQPVRTIHAVEQGRLSLDPRVAIVFAYESSPRARAQAVLTGTQTPLDKGVDYEDHYTFLGTLAPGGKALEVQHLNPEGVEPPDAAELYPLVLRHDLRMFVDVEGTSNRPDLDVVAKDLVRRALDGPDQMHGEDGEATTFYPIQPTGAVTSCSWAVEQVGNGTVARTRWRAGWGTDLRGGPAAWQTPGNNGLGTAGDSPAGSVES